MCARMHMCALAGITWGLVRTQNLGPTPRDFHSGGLGWAHICISNTLSRDADAAGPGTTL